MTRPLSYRPSAGAEGEVAMTMKVVRSARLAALAATFMTASTAQAESQSSNTSSNSSSNNGVVRERVVDSYCKNGYCERYHHRRVYRDDRRTRWRGDDERRPYRHFRYYDKRSRK
jgi:hypothetical protein